MKALSIFLALVATVMACVVGNVVIKSTRLQNDSLHWPTVVGQMTRSGLITTPHKNKGHTTYTSTADLAYRYQVGNQQYSGERLRFTPVDRWFSDDLLETVLSANATSLVSRYKLGSPVTVSYNPEDPRTAILLPGTSPLDGLFLLAILPLVSAAVAAWSTALQPAPEKTIAGLRLETDGAETRVILDDKTPLAAGFDSMALLASGVCGLSFIAALNGVVDPFSIPQTWVEAAYGAIFTVSLCVGISTAGARTRGTKDLVVAGRTLSFRDVFRRRDLAFSDVRSCEAVRDRNSSVVRVTWSEGESTRTADVWTSMQHPSAQELADWLVSRCGVRNTVPVAGAPASILGVPPSTTSSRDVDARAIFRPLLVLGLLVLAGSCLNQAARLGPVRSAAQAYESAPQSTDRHDPQTRQLVSVTVDRQVPLGTRPPEQPKVMVHLLLPGGGRLQATLGATDAGHLRNGDAVTAELYNGGVTQVQAAGQTLQAADSPPAIYQDTKEDVYENFGFIFAFATAIGLVSVLVRWLLGSRERALTALAAQNGWRYEKRLADLSEARTLPPHFTVHTSMTDVVVSTPTGTNALLRPGRPFVVSCEYSLTTGATAFFVRLDKTLSPFRVAPRSLQAKDVLSLVRGEKDFKRDFTVEGMDMGQFHIERSALCSWLEAHKGWNVTGWEQWLICTRTDPIEPGRMAARIEEALSLAAQV